MNMQSHRRRPRKRDGEKRSAAVPGTISRWSGEEVRKLREYYALGFSTASIAQRLRMKEKRVQDKIYGLRLADQRRGRNFKTCLGCGHEFPSRGRFNRLCRPCSTRYY